MFTQKNKKFLKFKIFYFTIFWTLHIITKQKIKTRELKFIIFKTTV